jgi:photosystem II stability/assembly factor-like uncharacterized protein
MVRTRRETERPVQRAKGPLWRRKPWYRRGGPWVSLLAAAAAGVVGAVIIVGGNGTPSPGRPYVGGDLHSLIVDPTDPSRLFVGGHGGVAVSTDQAKTWRTIGTLNGADAMGWAFTDEAILVGGHPGLFVSTDDGRTFAQENEGLPATDIHALGAGEGIIYAASPQAGVFASTDGGDSWQMRTRGAGQTFMGPLLVDPRDAQRLLAPDMQAGGIAESTDGGRTWRSLGGMPGAMWLTWDANDTDHVIASGAGQAVETTDGGATWRQIEVPTGALALEMDPASGRLYAAVHEGTEAVVWVSTDGGATWRRP